MAALIRERTRSFDLSNVPSPLRNTQLPSNQPDTVDFGWRREYSYMLTATGRIIDVRTKDTLEDSPFSYATSIIQLTKRGKLLIEDGSTSIYRLVHSNEHASILKIHHFSEQFFSPTFKDEVETHQALLEEGIPNIPMLKKAFCTPPINNFTSREVAILMEEVGKDCFELYLRNQNNSISLNQLQEHMTYWLSTLSKMHQNGWIYRDVKPENLGKKHIMDFDKTIRFNKHMRFSSAIGTLRYLPPEALEKTITFSTKSDSFSLGITLYTLFMQNYFIEEEEEIFLNKYYNNPDKYLKILQTKLTSGFDKMKEDIRARGTLKDEDEDNVERFIDLLEKLLKLDPKERLSCEDALSHPFMKEFVQESSSSASSASSSSEAA